MAYLNGDSSNAKTCLVSSLMSLSWINRSVDQLMPRVYKERAASLRAFSRSATEERHQSLASNFEDRGNDVEKFLNGTPVYDDDLQPEGCG
jgi:chloramphenicol 3-O-phosphotransferase